MCHIPLLDASFHAFLLCIDEDLVAETRAGRCQRCGGVLHKRRYPRKPRGGGLIDLGRGPHFRLSLACAKCSKRHTPPSVRFLGQRVYLAVAVVLASALHSGLTGRRAAQLTECLRVPRRTIERWRAWWLQGFAKTRFWSNARARFMPPVAAGALPASLLERFEGPDLSSQVVAALRFLIPLDEGP
jgi:hypothetical protein